MGSGRLFGRPPRSPYTTHTNWKDLEPEQCPRFETCNAPICPLDKDWRKHYRKNGEAICYYLNHMMKEGADERFADDPTFALCKLRLPEIVEVHPLMGKAIERAGEKPGKGDHLRKKKA